TFIPNPDYVSSSYKDIKITATLDEDKDSVKATCTSFGLFSKGVRKDEPADEKGINHKQEEPWNSKLKGRLFVDTDEEWDGICIEERTFDKQQVIFYTLVKPKDIPLDKLKIHWELEDPDDPATSRTIDPGGRNRYDPLKDPLTNLDFPESSTDEGADNTGIAHEGSDFWFKGDYIEKTENNDYPNIIIGEAITQLKEPKFPYPPDYRISLVHFNFSDHGGDNFIVRAKLFDGDKEICSKETGTLTVWRKRCAQIMAMRKDSSFKENFYPSPSDEKKPYEIQKILQEGFGNPDPNKNMYIDFYVKNFSREDGSSITYKGKDSQNLPHEQIIDDYYAYINENIENVTLNGNKRSSPFFTIIGVDFILNTSSDGDDVGFAGAYPFIFIATGKIQFLNRYTYNLSESEYSPNLPKEIRDNQTKQEIIGTLIHEVGHLLSPYLPKEEFNLNVNDFHHGLEFEKTIEVLKEVYKKHPKYISQDPLALKKIEGAIESIDLLKKYYEKEPTVPERVPLSKWNLENCYFRSGVADHSQVCERHIRMLRGSIKRYFFYFPAPREEREKGVD
ncbi:MAG: hypothetical protein AABZ60_11350, partial [Planctomycetota bacterium]